MIENEAVLIYINRGLPIGYFLSVSPIRCAWIWANSINFGHIHNVVVEIISTLLQKLATFAKKNKKLLTENRTLQKVVHMQNNIEQEHQSAVYSLEYKIKELVARNIQLERLEEQHDRNIRLLHQKNKELQKALSQMGCVCYDE